MVKRKLKPIKDAFVYVEMWDGVVNDVTAFDTYKKAFDYMKAQLLELFKDDEDLTTYHMISAAQTENVVQAIIEDHHMGGSGIWRCELE